MGRRFPVRVEATGRVKARMVRVKVPEIACSFEVVVSDNECCGVI